MCPSGTGYNYFLACDTAERIIFAVVAGSGSGKLCWHSRGNDNDQENAGYVRESAGGSEQALRAEEVQKRSFCRRSFPHFFRCWKKWGRRRQKKRSRGGRRPGGEQVLRLRARDGEFRAPARVTFFCCQKKVTKENHLDLRFKDPLARYGLCKIGGMHSRMKCGG